MVKKVVDLKARVYADEPKRTIDGSDADILLYQEIAEQSALGIKMKLASRYAKLLKTLMVKELRASRAVIVGKLAALADDAGKNWDDLSLNRRKELLTAQLAAVDAVLVDVYASAGKSLQEAGEDVIAASAKQAATAMSNNDLGVKVDVGQGSQRQQESKPPVVNANTKVINVVDGKLLGEYMKSSEGEKILVNVITRAGFQRG